MTKESGEAPNALTLWWWRRLARRRQIAAAVLDLHDRYGGAAHGIARNTARRGAYGERRFWRRVARKLRVRDFVLARLADQRAWAAAILGPRVGASPDVIGLAIGAADMAAGDDRR
jgi:hypothetical protein